MLTIMPKKKTLLSQKLQHTQNYKHAHTQDYKHTQTTHTTAYTHKHTSLDQCFELYTVAGARPRTTCVLFTIIALVAVGPCIRLYADTAVTCEICCQKI